MDPVIWQFVERLFVADLDVLHGWDIFVVAFISYFGSASGVMLALMPMTRQRFSVFGFISSAQSDDVISLLQMGVAKHRDRARTCQP